MENEVKTFHVLHDGISVQNFRREFLYVNTFNVLTGGTKMGCCNDIYHRQDTIRNEGDVNTPDERRVSPIRDLDINVSYPQHTRMGFFENRGSSIRLEDSRTPWSYEGCIEEEWKFNAITKGNSPQIVISIKIRGREGFLSRIVGEVGDYPRAGHG